jgi:uncharacterized protein YjbI with pentapeptide repeats
MRTATTKTVNNVSPTIRTRSTRAHRVVSASSKRWNQTDDDDDADASSSLARLATRACVAATLAATLATCGHAQVSLAAFMEDIEDTPSVMGLKLKPRDREVILESKSEHVGGDFTSENLIGAVFAEAELRGSDFHGADCRGAVFSRAIMAGVNFSGVDATNGFFDYALLRGADMSNSVMAGSNFVRADLGEVNATNADFTEAVIDRYQLLSLCENASGTNPYTKVDTRESLGCDFVKPYQGSGGGGKIAVSKNSGTWGGAK